MSAPLDVCLCPLCRPTPYSPHNKLSCSLYSWQSACSLLLSVSIYLYCRVRYLSIVVDRSRSTVCNVPRFSCLFPVLFVIHIKSLCRVFVVHFHPVSSEKKKNKSLCSFASLVPTLGIGLCAHLLQSPYSSILNTRYVCMCAAAFYVSNNNQRGCFSKLIVFFPMHNSISFCVVSHRPPFKFSQR